MTEDYIFEMLYSTYGHTKEQITSSSRKRELVMTRMLASYLFVLHCGKTKVDAGKILSIDHSTVIYHINKIEDAIQGFDSSLLDYIQKIEHLPLVWMSELARIKQMVLQNPDKSLIETLKQYIKDNENKEIKPQKLY